MQPENPEPTRTPLDPATQPPDTSRPRPRRRWGRRIAVLGGLLLIAALALGALAPTLLSSGAGSRWLIAQVNARIAGRLSADGLALSWTGPQTLRGLRVADPEQRDVLAVERVTVGAGLWNLITSGLALGDVTITSPRVTLYVDEHNQTSLPRAFALRRPSPPDPNAKLPDIGGKLIVRDGRVRAERAGGAAYEVTRIEGEVALNSLATIDARLSAALADQTSLTLDAALRDFVHDNRIDPPRSSGTFALQTAQPVALEPLTRFLTPERPVSGTLRLDLKADTQGADLRATIDAAVAQLQTAERAAANAEPLDLTLKGDAARTGDDLTAKLALSGAAGSAALDVNYSLAAAPPANLKLDDLLAALLSGAPAAVPDFSARLDGAIDLARLERAVPGLLNVRPGLQVTSGRLEFAELRARGGPAPSASGTLTLKDIAAAGDGRTIRLEPVTLNFSGAVEQGQGLKLERADLAAAFASLRATGTARALDADFRADLGRLHSELGQVFEFGDLDLAGQFSGKLQLQRAADDRIDVTLDATGAQLRVAGGGRRFDAQQLRTQQTGVITLAAQRPTRLELKRSEATIDDQLAATLTGWFDLASQGFDLAAQLTRADLGFLGRQAAPLGLPELARYGGNVELQATFTRSAAAQPIATTGSLTARNLTADARPLAQGDTRVTWDTLQIAPAGALSAGAVKLESTVATLDARQVRLDPSDVARLSAELTASADLQPLFTAIAAIAKLEKPPALAGALSLSASLAPGSAGLSARGQGAIANLTIGSGAGAFRDPKVTLDFAAQSDAAGDRLTIDRILLKGAPLSAEISGAVTELRGPTVLALQGRYDAGWDQLTALLHELVPATAEEVRLVGRSAGEFELAGALRRPGATPAYRELSGGTSIAWDRADVFGVRMQAARLTPALADARLTLPSARIPAEGGQVNLGGALDLSGAEPTLRIPGKLQLLSRVTITPALSRSLLGRINPIFMHVAKIDGAVTLETNDVALPLGESLKTSGGGRGVLDLAGVRLQPGGLLGEILELSGRAQRDLQSVEVSRVDFVIERGRLRYDNLTLSFSDRFDLKFYGSVGFDETLDLVVSMPVGPLLLDRLAVRGAGAVLTQNLAALRVDVPLVGTRENPRLDFSKVDTEKLVRQLILPDDPAKGIGDIIRGIGGEEPQQPPPSRPRPTRPGTPTPKRPR